MALIIGNFAGPGTSGTITLPYDYRITVNVTGVFTARIELQERAGTAGWRTIEVFFKPEETVFNKTGAYRLVCTSLISGSVDYELRSEAIRTEDDEETFTGSASEVTYDNGLGGNTSAQTVQAALDDLFETGVPVLIRPTRVVRNGVNGVTSGTLDDVAAEANRVAIQAIIDGAITDRAVIEPDGATFQIANSPLLFRSTGFGLTWRGPLSTAIAQRSNNVAIIQISDTGGGGQVIGLDFDGVSLFYLNDQSGQGTPTTIGATMCVFGNMWKCKIKNIRAANTTTFSRPYRNFYMPSGSSVFSCDFSNLYGFQPHYSNLHIANFGTGNAYTNIYLSGVGNAGTAQAVAQPFLWQLSGGQQMHDSVFNQLNIEWCIANQVMRINNVRGAVFNSLHIEQNRLSGAASSFINNVISNIQINGLVLLDNRIIDADVSDSVPSLIKHFNAGRTNIDTLFMITNSAGYIDMPFYLHYQADAEGYTTQPGRVTVRGARFTDGAGTTIRDNLRIDRNMGLTDILGGDWGPLYLDSATEIRCGGAITKITDAEFNVPVSKTLYGQAFDDATIRIGSSLAADTTFTLSNRMGPASSRWANLPVPTGSVRTFIRGGTAVNAAIIANHDGSTITTIANGAATSRVNVMFNGTNWVSAA